MLHMVPESINRMARSVVIHHPNSVPCKVIRQTITRAGAQTIGGIPTLGGLGVISSDDEEQIEWNFVGLGFALRAEPFQASLMMDRQDANNGYAEEFRFLIEPEVAGAFAIKKMDVFHLIFDNVMLAYQVVGIESTSDIPPYTQRYICNRRDDMHYVE